MDTKKRYIVAVPEHIRRRTGLSLQDVSVGLPEERLVRSGKADVHVFELTLDEARDLAQKHTGLLIDDDQELTLLAGMPTLGFQIKQNKGMDYSFSVFDAETNEPVADTAVYVKGVNATYRGDTSKDGKTTISVFESSIEHVIVSPAANYWSKLLPAPAQGETMDVALATLIPQGAGAWSHKWLGLWRDSSITGKGVKVAILDSGVADHPDLIVAGGFNTLDGQDPAGFRIDEKGHGTHCAGVIAGRNAENGVRGIAPEAEIYSVKTFPGGRVSDLVEGIQWCMDNGIDVINMSLGISNPSTVLMLKLAEAVRRGLTIVAAGGNEGGPLAYPAAYDGLIAVTALGQKNAFSQETAHALRIGEFKNDENGLFVANFSNSGPQTAFIAPGVAIVSSVPGGYASWDGTSMACAFVSGLAALVLSAHPEIRTGDARQSASVRRLLAKAAINLTLPQQIQGNGLPRADQALASAVAQLRSKEQAALTEQQDLRQLDELIAEIESQQQVLRSLIARLAKCIAAN